MFLSNTISRTRHAQRTVNGPKPDTAPESPYRKAQEAWDSRIGATVVQAKNWRYAFFMVALLSCVLAGGLIAQSFKHQVVPIVITLDKNKGEPQVIGKVGDIDYQPQRAEIQFFIGRFIQAVRGVPADAVVIRRNWAEAYALLRPGAAATLNAMTNQDPDSPLKKIGQEVVAVQLIGIVRGRQSIVSSALDGDRLQHARRRQRTLRHDRHLHPRNRDA